MGRLSALQIKTEVEEKGYQLIDCSGYTSLQSKIKVKCPKGHIIEVSMADFRAPWFECPECNKKIVFNNPTAVPPKNGYRVIAFDQATENFGLSIYDNGELKFLSLYVFKGLVSDRLLQIKRFVEMIVKNWSPDFIVFEDIQYQPKSGVVTFKILAMLLGIIEMVCKENNIPYEIVSPNVWRKYAGTCGKTRLEEKKLSVAVVKEKYGIKVNDDVAEAVLIGNYGAKMHKEKIEMAFGIK